MSGTIIITGANGSLAIPAIKYLLANYPGYDAVLTVRNASDADVHTEKLRKILAQFPDAKASIHELDLANLSNVHTFASKIISEVAEGKIPPLTSIICNAYYWNLVDAAKLTGDGYERTFQVIHISHAALVLRLLGSFGSHGGRVVLFSSDAHISGKNGLEKYPPKIPSDLDLLVHPAVDVPSDNFGRGFQRYAVSKLAVVMWMYALNRYLQKVSIHYLHSMGVRQSPS